MKRRLVIAFLWLWGLWSFGSALDFLHIMPIWPLLLLGLGIAALTLSPRSLRRAGTVVTTADHAATH